MGIFKNILFLVIPGLLSPVISVNAQSEVSSVPSVVSDLLEELASSEIESSDMEEISEDLSYLFDHPLNLNLASEEELKHLHLLNDFQIYTLLEYIHEYGPVLSLSELQTIIGFSEDIIEKIQPFVILSLLPEPANMHSGRIKQEFLFKYSARTEKKKNNNDTITELTTYPGKNRSIVSRYQLKSGTAWRAGLTTEQDPGETFKLPGKPFKPDFISTYAEMNRKGLINYFILGDFRASYGQGLAVGNHQQRKGSAVLLKPQRTGIRKYSSTGENDFFRGAALRLKYEKLSMEIFYSRLSRDATVYFDSCNYIKSLSANGLHRTEKELQKKDAILLKSLGTSVSYKTRIIDIGFTCFSQSLDADYLIKTDPFVSDRLRKGESLRNISSDYKLNFNKTILYGELASDYKGRISMLNGLLVELHPLVHFCFLYRRYHPSYLGLKACGFGEKSLTRNEVGYYTGLEMYPWKYLKIDIFADHYKFPFPDISSSVPLSGNEYFLNCCFLTDNKSEFNFRTRYEKKESRTDRHGPGIDLTDVTRKISNRFELKFIILQRFTLKSRTELNFFKKSDSKWINGYYCGNDLGFEKEKPGFKFWIRYAVFDIPGWDNRIYAYENDMLYSFSTPVFNSKGSRIILLTKICPAEKIECWLKYSYTMYYGVRDKESGNNVWSGNHSPFLSVQMRVKF